MNVDDVTRFRASRLGQSCVRDRQCEMSDPHSHCKPTQNHEYQLVFKCTCKANFNLEIVNNTDRCVYHLEEPDFEDLTAAPIILCFVGCIVIEIVCLLGFRYWKKHRMQTIFQRQDMGFGQTQSQRFNGLASTSLPVVTFSVMHPPNPVISGVYITAAPSPPPYFCGTNTQTPQTPTCSTTIMPPEDVLPDYEEAVKMTVSVRNVDEQPCYENEDSERKLQTQD